MTFTGNRIQNM